MVKRQILFFYFLFVVTLFFTYQEKTALAADVPTINYRTHVQSYGWQSYVSNGSVSGTVGKSKRLEAIEIYVTNIPSGMTGGITYRTHVQSYGWQSWVYDGSLSGTSGQSKRLEAIQIKLTGTISNNYDVIYRVHAQSFGWLGWAKNGECAGTSGYSKRLEGIQIKAVAKNSVNTDESKSYIAFSNAPKIRYNLYAQTYGWLEGTEDGRIIGVAGESKRCEAIYYKITDNKNISGGLIGSAYVQTYGWIDAQTGSNNYAGSTGNGLRMEAIKVNLTGNMAKDYDLYYRVHVQKFGWLGWAKNGQPAGTFNYGARIEAVQMVISHKAAKCLPAGYSGSIGGATRTNQTKTMCSSKTNSTDRRIPKYTGAGNVSYKTVNYSWTPYYNGSMSSYSMSINNNMFNYYKGLRRYSKLSTQSINYIKDSNNETLVKTLVTQFKSIGSSKGLSDYQIIQEVTRFVQSMTYTTDIASRGYSEFPKYPIETLMDNGGDCEDTAILLASILKEMGYGVVLIEFDEHMAVGLLGDDSLSGTYFQYNNSKYFYIETTAVMNIGEMPSVYNNQTATIIPVN